MGIMDMVKSAVSQYSGVNQDHATAAGGLVEEMQQRPGGLGGLLQSFQQNGMGGLVSQWAGGQTAPAQPNEVEQGLGGTGIIDSIAQRTGLSAGMVKAGLAVAVPLVIHHMVSNGHTDEQGQPAGQPVDHGGLLGSILGRMM